MAASPVGGVAGGWRGRRAAESPAGARAREPWSASQCRRQGDPAPTSRTDTPLARGPARERSAWRSLRHDHPDGSDEHQVLPVGLEFPAGPRPACRSGARLRPTAESSAVETADRWPDQPSLVPRRHRRGTAAMYDGSSPAW